MKILTVFSLFALVSLSALAQVSIDPPSRSFTKDGGAGAILTQGSGAWSATTADNWITISPRTSGTVGDSCIYIVASNFSADTRIGQVNVDGNIHSVSQSGYSATLSPSSATVNLDGGQGSVSLSVAAGVAWSAASNTDWISVSPASGVSSGSVSYTVEPNPGVTTRNGSLTVAGQTFTVTQTGTDVNLSPKDVEKAYSSDIIQLQVTALVSTNWSVTPSASWISVIDDGNGFGDSAITLAVGTNPSFEARTGTVTIGSATFTIVQAGTPYPLLDIVPDEATADPIGAFGNAAILATPDAPWAAESEAPWIIIAEGESGAGNGNIEYVVSANPNLEARTGRIQVSPPVADPQVDLSKQLLCHIKTGSSTGEGSQDRSGWNRDLSGSLATEFDGTTPLDLSGQDFNRSDDAFSVAFWFTLEEIDAINRLLEVQRGAGYYSAVYINAANQLIFSSGSQTLTTDLVVEANTPYHVVVATDVDGLTTVYAGRRSASIATVGSQVFAAAPFPAAYVTPEKIDVGRSTLPSAGNLTNASIDDLRLYGRALNADEADALFEHAGSALPYGMVTHTGDPQNVLLEYNLQGQALVVGGSTQPQAFSSADAASFHDFIAKSSLSTTESVLYTHSLPVPRLIAGITSRGEGAYYSTYTQGTLFWRHQLVYADGSTAFTAEASKYTEGSVSVYKTNPFPAKPVAQIRVYVRSSISSSGLTYKMHSSQIRYLAETEQLTGWHPSHDRYNRPLRALAGDSDARVALLNHSSSYSDASATYNFWLRFDTLGEAVIFGRDQLGENTLICGLNSSANLYLSWNGNTTTFPVDLHEGQWHMLTIAAEHGLNTKLYLDGAEFGNTAVHKQYSLGSHTDQQDLIIGGWDGAIDYAGFYEAALSSAQIQSLYDNQKFELQYHTVTQGVVSASLSAATATELAAGGSGSVNLTVAGNVNWSAESSVGWIQLTSRSSGSGSATIAFDVVPNTSVYQRTGTLSIAGESFTLTQAGLNATLDYTELVFGTDGGSDWIEVFPEANATWQAISNDSWLTIASGASGSGTGSVLLVADPYSQTSQSRTGTIEVAGQTIYVTQRGYQLSVSPEVAQVGSNSGAGEVGVAAPLTAVWEAITSVDWITINGSNSGVGSGTLRYSVAENTTGASRTGRIIISGTEYTITQVSSLQVSATAAAGGSVSGAGGYQTNATAVLSATADAGYVFSHWTGDAVGSANPLSLSVDSDKEVTAHFIPSSAATSFQSAGQNAVLADPNAYDLYNADQLRSMAVKRPFLSVDTATNKVTVGFGLKETDDLSNWSDVDIQSSQTFIRNGTIEVELTVDDDAKFYQVITQ
ncbi:MAG TPA: hypothetical protein DD423_07335 [Opitutae bacterium]|nr:hypothetical protein [Opitutae bacterium]